MRREVAKCSTMSSELEKRIQKLETIHSTIQAQLSHHF